MSSKTAHAPADITLRPLFEMTYGLSMMDVGPTAFGRRMVFGTTGGHFFGERLSGAVMPGGVDFALVGQGGHVEIDADVMLQTQDGALIHARWQGVVVAPAEVLAAVANPSARAQLDPSRYYMRTAARFECSSKSHAWLCGIVSVATTCFTEQGLHHKFYQVE